MNGMDAFDRSIKNSLEQFEVPYNSADWAQMEKTLDSGRNGSWLSGSGLYVALLAGALAIGGGIYLYERSNTSGAGDVAQTNIIAPTSNTLPAGNGTVVSPVTPANAPIETATTGANMTGTPGMNSATQVNTITGSASTTAGATAASSTKPNANTNVVVPTKAAKSLTTEPAETAAPKSDKPKASENGLVFHASQSEGCTNSAVTFEVANMAENARCLWNFGDGSFSKDANPKHIFNKSGRFTVTLSVTSAGGGTIQNNYADLIVIHELPEASFNFLKQEYAGHVPSVHFENRSHGGVKYFWDFGDGSTSTIAHPDHVFRTKGDYKVTLTTTNEMGCEDNIERVVKIDSDYNLLAPASFSPNGDGNDDLFMPEALKDLGVKFHLSIYDEKSGNLVYETSDASKPWTGRFRNRGELCANGDYVWMVEIQEGLHLGDINYEGKVSLVK